MSLYAEYIHYDYGAKTWTCYEIRKCCPTSRKKMHVTIFYFQWDTSRPAIAATVHTIQDGSFELLGTKKLLPKSLLNSGY